MTSHTASRMVMARRLSGATTSPYAVNRPDQDHHRGMGAERGRRRR